MVLGAVTTTLEAGGPAIMTTGRGYVFACRKAVLDYYTKKSKNGKGRSCISF